MGCAGCTVNGQNGQPAGCRSNGGCGSGGCNRLNTYDWLSVLEVTDADPFDIVEVTFKNGARKSFFRNPQYLRAVTGDMVVVETGNGYDVGRVALSGELVRLQMRKKKTSEDQVLHQIIRRANERDLERLQEARNQEAPTMIRARAIARTLGLEMKIGDVEYQGDKRKATFYYTADGRVDFRELIRHYAKEFRVKIEMRQIGARQESARIGGLGSCGRELCCSTWLTDFKSVSTAAARYQNLAINQSKLSGQCGRLKCCLNYELDTYMEAVERFPRGAEKLQTEAGTAVLVKTDIFKKLMYYAYDTRENRGKIFALDLENVESIREMNKRGEKPTDLNGMQVLFEDSTDSEIDFDEDLTGVIELPPEEKRKKKRRKNRRKKKNPPSSKPQSTARTENSANKPKSEGGGDGNRKTQRKKNNRRRGRGGKNRGGGNNNSGGQNN